MKNMLRMIALVLIAFAASIVWDGFHPQGGSAGGHHPIWRSGRHADRHGRSSFQNAAYSEVRYFDKRILIWDGDPNQIPTNDKTFIYMENTARWRIADPLRFLQAVGTERRAMTLLDDILDGTVRDMVNKNNLIEIIRSSDWSPDFMAATVQSQETICPPVLGRDKISQMVLEDASDHSSVRYRTVGCHVQTGELH